MKNFTEAKTYILNTPAQDIAQRTAIFGAYFNYFFNKDLGHDILLDVVAALYGPFDYKVKDDKIMEMLYMINFGFDSQWTKKLCLWAVQYAKNEKEMQDFLDMLKILFDYKGDEILEYFEYICKVLQPKKENYFPEMCQYAMFDNVEIWPRI